MENCQFYRGSDIVLFVQMRMKNTTVRWQISFCGFDIPISWLELYIYIPMWRVMSPKSLSKFREPSAYAWTKHFFWEPRPTFFHDHVISDGDVSKKTTNQLGPLQHPHPGMKLEVSTCSADPIDLWYNMAMRNPLKICIWTGNLSTNGGCPMAMFDYQRAIGLWLGVS